MGLNRGRDGGTGGARKRSLWTFFIIHDFPYFSMVSTGQHNPKRREVNIMHSSKRFQISVRSLWFLYCLCIASGFSSLIATHGPSYAQEGFRNDLYYKIVISSFLKDVCSGSWKSCPESEVTLRLEELKSNCNKGGTDGKVSLLRIAEEFPFLNLDDVVISGFVDEDKYVQLKAMQVGAALNLDGKDFPLPSVDSIPNVGIEDVRRCYGLMGFDHKYEMLKVEKAYTRYMLTRSDVDLRDYLAVCQQISRGSFFHRIYRWIDNSICGISMTAMDNYPRECGFFFRLLASCRSREALKALSMTEYGSCDFSAFWITSLVAGGCLADMEEQEFKELIEPVYDLSILETFRRWNNEYKETGIRRWLCDGSNYSW